MGQTNENDMTCTIERQSQKHDLQHLLIVRHGDRWDYQHPEVGLKELIKFSICHSISCYAIG